MLLFETDVKKSIEEKISTPNNNNNRINFSSKIHMNQYNLNHMLICLTTQKININQTQQKTFPHVFESKVTIYEMTTLNLRR